MLKSKSSPDDPKPRRWPLLVAAALLAAGVAFRLFREIQVVSSTPVTSWERETSADCGVVLTGGPGRVREGFDLLAERRIKKLIVSGVHPEVRLRDLMPAWTFYGNLREEDVVLEKRSETTWGNAQQSLPIVEALRCRDILLITSQLHMARAYRTFRASFPDAVDIQTQAVVGNRYRPPLWEVLTEALKSLFYSFWAY